MRQAFLRPNVYLVLPIGITVPTWYSYNIILQQSIHLNIVVHALTCYWRACCSERDMLWEEELEAKRLQDDQDRKRKVGGPTDKHCALPVVCYL